MKILKYIFIIFFTLCSTICSAQKVFVDQSIDSVSILIGQQTHLTLSVTAKPGSRIVWPKVKTSHFLVPGIEILKQQNIVSSESDGMKKFSRIYTLTSFDEKLYSVPALEIKVDGKSHMGKQLALKVMTVPVDTLHPNKFYPAKGVQDNPFLWKEWSLPFWLSILFIVLCLLTVYFIVRLKQNKPIVARAKIVKLVPAHQKALKAIEDIKAEHMMTSQDQKEYYTRLTDALRQYIKERFGFNAKEMTSSEIIYLLQKAGDQKGIDELRELFTTADLVKFAKYNALINENDLNLVNAAKFINDTKSETQEIEKRVVPELTAQEQLTKKNRLWLKFTIYSLIVVLISLVIYILYLISELLGF